MKKIIVTISLILSGFILLPESTCASHLAGAEITYTYQGSLNTYLFRLKFYRDCSGIPASLPTNLCLSSVSLNFAILIPLNVVAINIVTSPPCVNIPPANCIGGTGTGIEEYILETVYTLPNAATDWLFSWSDCCLNISTNIQSNGMYVSTTLDNINHPTDNSPVFNFIPYTTLCLGVPYYLDDGAIDPDGDSLVFNLVSAQENFGCPPSPVNALYNLNPLTNIPYSALQPMSSFVPMTIDGATGIIYLIPSLLQVAQVCVLVTSYSSNGLLIGTVKRDMQVVVTNQCNIVIPSFPAGPNSSTYFPIGDPTMQVPGPYYCGDSQFILPFSEAVQCNSIVPSDFRVVRSLGFPNPIISAVPINCINGYTDSIEITCLYPLTAGNNLVTIKTGTDGNTLLSQCGSAMQPYHDTVAIIINDFSLWQPVTDSLGCVFNQKTLTFNENLFCYTIANDGSDLQLTDSAGSIIPISAAYGYCGPNDEQSNKLLITFANMQTPSSTVYYLTVKTGNDGNTLANQCGRFMNAGDTLAIFYVSNGMEVNLGSDLSICTNDSAPLLSSGFTDPSLTYQWIFNSNNISGATNPGYTATNGAGNYTLNIYLTGNQVCHGSDTMQLIVNPAPVININDTTGCIGTSIVLDAGFFGAAYRYQWYLYGAVLPADTNQLLTVTQSGIYTVLVSVGNCFSYDSAVVSFYQALTVPSFNNQAVTVCTGSAIPLLDAGTPGLTYQWSINNVIQPNDTSQTFTPSINSSGIYTISLIMGAGSCMVTASMLLTVVDYPLFNNQNDTVCTGILVTPLDAGISGLNYQWNVNGVLQPDTTQTFFPSSDLPGTFVISLTISTTTCSVNSSMVLTVVGYPWLFVNDDHECEGNVYPTFNAGNIPGATYEWQDVNWTVVSSSNFFTPPSSLTEGEYYYYPIVTKNGCSYGEEVIFTVEPPCPLNLPNIITPNGDYINDAFIIRSIEKYPNNHMIILNRWGKQVYSDTYNNSDNVFRGTDLPEGLYFFMLDLGDGKTEPIGGSLTILH